MRWSTANISNFIDRVFDEIQNKWDERQARRCAWHAFFAWHPVKVMGLDGHTWIWLEKIERSMRVFDNNKYRIPEPNDTNTTTRQDH